VTPLDIPARFRRRDVRTDDAARQPAPLLPRAPTPAAAPNLPTLVSPMSMPSLSSSPWIRGAPHSGFSRFIWRISFRISRETGGRPGWPRRTFQVQTNRNPLRCQAITVSGFTMTRADRQPVQNRDKEIDPQRSASVASPSVAKR
jgi:hypothetical protein